MQGKSLKVKKLKQPAVLSERTSALAINFAYTKVSNNSSKEIASPNICDRPPIPPPPPSPLTRRSHKGRLYGRGSGVLDIFYLQTAHFFRLEMCHKPILCPNVAQKCKTCPRLPEPQKFCFKHKRCSKVK